MTAHEAASAKTAAGGPSIRAPAGARRRRSRAAACPTGPAVEVGHHQVDHASVAKVAQLAARGETHPAIPPYQTYEAYVAAGGYAVLRSCLSGVRKVDDVIAALSDGGLRGLGGA